METSTPTLEEFDPTQIPFQYKVIKDVRNHDYSDGTLEILCSGAVGSAKSLLGAHLAVTHCLANPGAQLLVGRKTMPSLKDTLFKKIIEHIGEDVPYEHNKNRSIITFPNRSTIIPYSWADSNFKKVRSLDLSAAIIEELTENEDLEFYQEILMRVGRLTHVQEKFVLSMTNPDDPSHPAYKYFIEKENKKRKVYYSKTLDNPFLPESYVSQLEANMDPKMARRMLYGEWLSIAQDVIYYGYSKDHNYKKEAYKVNPSHPIHFSFDFNIGIGKPLSVVFFQYIDSIFHVYDEIIIEGSRTEDALEEAFSRGLLDEDTEYQINGDATGRHRDTRSKHSDWDIIRKFMDNCKNSRGSYVRYRIDVPLTNPKIRDRHNIVNAQLHNAKGQRRVYVYEKAKVVDEGLRLTKLKHGALFSEDDSKYYQHCTTALGYGIIAALREREETPITIFKR
jgi:PBSX family phage terminase large subunit